jgi:hypothetical protein
VRIIAMTISVLSDGVWNSLICRAKFCWMYTRVDQVSDASYGP